MADTSAALRRIDTALARIETAAATRPPPAASTPGGEAEQMRATLHRALQQLDQMITELEGAAR